MEETKEVENNDSSNPVEAGSQNNDSVVKVTRKFDKNYVNSEKEAEMLKYELDGSLTGDSTDKEPAFEVVGSGFTATFEPTPEKDETGNTAQEQLFDFITQEQLFDFTEKPNNHIPDMSQIGTFSDTVENGSVNEEVDPRTDDFHSPDGQQKALDIRDAVSTIQHYQNKVEAHTANLQRALTRYRYLTGKNYEGLTSVDFDVTL